MYTLAKQIFLSLSSSKIDKPIYEWSTKITIHWVSPHVRKCVSHTVASVAKYLVNNLGRGITYFGSLFQRLWCIVLRTTWQSTVRYIMVARKERERIPKQDGFFLFPSYSIWALGLWDGATHIQVGYLPLILFGNALRYEVYFTNILSASQSNQVDSKD
jgi:hypothetical protein